MNDYHKNPTNDPSRKCREQAQRDRCAILDKVRKNYGITSKELQRKFHIPPTSCNRYLKEFIDSGALVLVYIDRPTQKHHYAAPGTTKEIKEKMDEVITPKDLLSKSWTNNYQAPAAPPPKCTNCED